MSSNRVALLPAFLVIFVDNFGFSLVFNMLGPLFLLPDYGLISPGLSIHVKNILIAIAYGVFPLSQLFAAPIIGDWADIYGRKKAFYLSLTGLTIGLALTSVSILVHSATMFIVMRFISGAFAGNQGIALASIADLSPTENARGRNFAIVTTLYGFSWILAMVIGGYLSNPRFMGLAGPPLAFFICAGLSFLNLVAIHYWFKETHITSVKKFQFRLLEGAMHVFKALCIPQLRVFFLIYLLWTVGWGMGIQWFAPYAIQVYHASTLATTTWFIIFGITWTLGSSVGNQLMLKYFKSLPIAVVCNIITTVFILVLAGIPNFEVFALLYTISAIFSAPVLSNTMNVISVSAPKEIQGKTMGLTSSMMAFGWIVSSIIAIIASTEAIGILYWICGVLMVVVSILLVWKWMAVKTV